jgi:hypothetical protein
MTFFDHVGENPTTVLKSRKPVKVLPIVWTVLMGFLDIHFTSKGARKTVAVFPHHLLGDFTKRLLLAWVSVGRAAFPGYEKVAYSSTRQMRTHLSSSPFYA